MSRPASLRSLTMRLRKRMGKSADELVWAIYLDRFGRILCDCQIARGSASAVSVPVRALAAMALAHEAAGLILLHNHPSGDPSPSVEDQRVTRYVVEALRPLGIALHDHIIVAGAAVASMRDLALM